jgi:hypothetical protein
MKFKSQILISTIFLLLSSFNSYAQVPVKIECTLKIKKQARSGETTTVIKDVLLDVVQTNGMTGVMSTDDDIRSVVLPKQQNVIEVINNSDENRWFFIAKTQDTKITTTKYMIDRNSGQILYTNDFNEGAVFTEATGRCFKVDTTKRKF